MYFSKTLGICSLAITASAAIQTTITYDPGYDIGSRGLDKVSCSNGDNGLITRYGWMTQREVTGFPYIGGAPGVTWNSPKCGACYSLTYNGKTVHIRAIDAAYGGFNIGKEAFGDLTDDNFNAGRVDATYEEVHWDMCN
ncbi:SnodProt1 [Thozetella sp. PMI_491]|nr:SnodProt1 [Thozetella sp. PMI_491]